MITEAKMKRILAGGWTAKAVATEACVKPAKYYQWEAGSAYYYLSKEEAERVAAVLGTAVEEIATPRGAAVIHESASA